jgi:Sigma-70, region 4
MQRPASIRCVQSSCALLAVCSAPWLTPRTFCLDQLKLARRQRETYAGTWLPDPVLEEEEEDVTLPLMLALERLSPLERAAFLLHDAFGLEFEEVGATIQRDPAACRQLAARAHPCPTGETAVPGGETTWP